MVFGEIDKTTGVGSITFEGYEETKDSREAYNNYHARIRNGCRLFGVYFQDLWTQFNYFTKISRTTYPKLLDNFNNCVTIVI